MCETVGFPIALLWKFYLLWTTSPLAILFVNSHRRCYQCSFSKLGQMVVMFRGGRHISNFFLACFFFFLKCCNFYFTNLTTELNESIATQNKILKYSSNDWLIFRLVRAAASTLIARTLNSWARLLGNKQKLEKIAVNSKHKYY